MRETNDCQEGYPCGRSTTRTLSESADVPGIDPENDEYLEFHGGRRGAGDTLVCEIGWEQAQRLRHYRNSEISMNAYSCISAGEVTEEASDLFDRIDR